MKEWIVEIIGSLGYLGIGFLMFLENLFPPIPSELIMPLAGFTASQPNNNLELIPAIAAGVIGTVLGAYPWYYIGKLVSEERLERWADKYFKWIGISGEDVGKSKTWFQKHGAKAVFLGRMVPGIRTLISLPAGIEEMPIVPFTIYTTLGTIIWTAALTTLGYKLGSNYELVDEYLSPVSKIVLGILVLGFAAWLLKKNLDLRNKGNG